MNEPAVSLAEMKSPRADGPAGQPHRKVLLITESGYPYRFSGVSTWCRLLVGSLSDVEYNVLAIVGEPDSRPIFELPANLTGLITIPLWGTREALEARAEMTFRRLREARRATDEASVSGTLVPCFQAFVESLLSETADPIELAHRINDLYEFFLVCDFDTSMHSEAVWKAFLAVAKIQFPLAAERAGYTGVPFGLSDAVTGMHWLYHWLLPISRPLPEADIVHATMAGTCTLPAVVMKLHHEAGFVFSEHGIYLREAYLREAPDRGSLFLKLLKVGFARRTSEISYKFADQISSCCEYNKRWEFRIGASPQRVSTIYYGLNPAAFRPAEEAKSRAPVVMWMGRIDPLKDLETLLRAASIVHGVRTDVTFRLYGSAAPGSEPYRERMLALRRTLGLDEVVEMAGYTSDPHTAYNEADIFVLSSISEGFPYSTLEAMLCGKPIVATAVGGIEEQVGECGLLVEPRNHEQLASALLELITDPAKAHQLGASARERAKDLFSLDMQSHLHLEMYSMTKSQLSTPIPAVSVLDARHGDLGNFAPLEPATTALVERIRTTVPHPIDDLEISAVVEATGISDAVASTRYGAHNAFQLGKEILSRLQAERRPNRLQPHEITIPSRELQQIPEIGRGLLMLFPAAVVLLISHFLTRVPGWTSGTGRALMLGVTSSLFITNAFLLGVVRRSSLLIGCERRRAARKFLWRTSWVAAASILVAEVVGVLVAGGLGHIQGSELTTFTLSFSGLAAFWIICAGLVLLGRSYEAGIAVLAGIGAGILTDHVFAIGSSRHLEIAILVAYVTTVAIIGGRVIYALSTASEPADGYRHPSSSFLLDEALPYLLYGGLLIALIFGPNLLTAFVATSRATSSMDLSTVEVGMTLALVPLMVSLYAADDALKRFWETTCRALSATLVENTDRFCDRLYQSHLVLRFKYLTRVLIASLACVPALWLLADTNTLKALGVHSTSLVMASFIVSLVSYLLLASAQFDSVIALTLARPYLALRSLSIAVGATAMVAATIFVLHQAEVGFVSLFVGTVVFAILANMTCRSFFRSLAFHYGRAM